VNGFTGDRGHGGRRRQVTDVDRGFAMGSALADVRDFSVSVLDGMTGPEFPADTVFSLLCPALGTGSAVRQCIRWRTGETWLQVHGLGPREVALAVDATRRLRSEHPLMVANAAGRLEPATAERAVGGASAWRRSPARDVLVQMTGVDQMVSLALRGGPTEVCALAFARAGRDFDDRELELLVSVQPFLQAVERHVQQLGRWRQGLGSSRDEAVASARDAGLTGRELSVLVLLGQGCSAAGIARRLGCSPRTVQKHVGNIYRKLGVADRLTAVLEAQRRCLLPAPGRPFVPSPRRPPLEDTTAAPPVAS
jgi:DNA-binding CsgD family transcriptional regulator